MRTLILAVAACAVLWASVAYAEEEEKATVDAVFQQGNNQYKGCELIDPWNSKVARKSFSLNRMTIRFDELALPGKNVTVQSARLEMFFQEESWSRIQNANLAAYDANEKDGKALAVKEYRDRRIDGKGPRKIGWVIWNIPVSVVRRWIANPASNKGLRFATTPTKKPEARFGFTFVAPSHDFAPQRPRLVITHTFEGKAVPFFPEIATVVAGKTFGPRFTCRWKKKRWDPNGTDVTYEAAIAPEGGEFTIVARADASTGGMALDTTELKLSTRYQLRMRAIDPDGLASEWVVAPGAFRVSRDEYAVWVADSVTKVQRGDNPPAGKPAVTLAAMRNEYESFQVVVTGMSDVKRVDLTTSEFKGPGGAVIPASAAKRYRVNYVNCQGEGWLPDSLVPFADPNTNKRIGGVFGAPFDVPSGTSMAVWVELHVPASAHPGTYSGSVAVTVNGTAAARVPVKLEVWPVTLANTTKLETYMCLKTQHSKRAYLNSLHNHRVDVWFIETPSEGSPSLERDAQGKAVVKWNSEYDKMLDAYFDGSMFADGVPGKTYLFGYGQWQLLSALKKTGDDRIAILKQFQEHYGKKPWIKKVAWFFIDEPSSSAASMAYCVRVGKEIKKFSPSIKMLLTTKYSRDLVGLIDIWDPILDHEVINWNSPGPEVYRDEVNKGRKAINCITVMSNTSTTPNLFIHHKGMNTRIWTWVTYNLGMQGIEFWDTSPAPSVTKPKKYGAAWGDGSLFYRGLPEELGVSEEIALPSIRLKMLRDGIEDYELLSMLAARDPARARKLSHMMVQETRSYDGTFKAPVQRVSYNWNTDGKGDREVPGFIIWESNAARLSAARKAIADALVEKW